MAILFLGSSIFSGFVCPNEKSRRVAPSTFCLTPSEDPRSWYAKKVDQKSPPYREGGYRSPEEQWPHIQDNTIRDMDRLEKALQPYLKQLKVSA